MYTYLSRTLSRLLLLRFLLSCGACHFLFPSTSLGGSDIDKIDKTVWERYFGDVGAEPALPSDIVEILDSDCPFWPGKQVKDTHLLVLIPERVNGKPLTLDYLGELIKSPRGGGYGAKYRDYHSYVRNAVGHQAPGRSYWVLMTRRLLPESEYKNYDSQCQLVVDHANRTGLDYELPGALEAAVVLLLHHVRSGERLYSDNPLTYTRCRDKDKDGDPLIVGGFSSAGLHVSSSNCAHDSLGVSALRKF
ncbi:MAG: hypothetical protein AAF400_01270 [Bacteroidota bacterium]